MAVEPGAIAADDEALGRVGRHDDMLVGYAGELCRSRGSSVEKRLVLDIIRE